MYFHGYELILNSSFKSMMSQLTTFNANEWGKALRDDLFGLNRNHCSL